MKKIIALTFIIILFFSSCRFLMEEEIGFVEITMPLVESYGLKTVDLFLRDNLSGNSEVFSMKINYQNSLARKDIQLKKGSYSAYIIQEKLFDYENDCALYSQTPLLHFVVREGIREDITFENPWISTPATEFKIDVSSMIDNGIQPEYAAIWLESVEMNPADPYEEENNYHFYIYNAEDQYLTGSFPVRSGEYKIKVVPENRNHRDWDINIQPLYPNLTVWNTQDFISVNGRDPVIVNTSHALVNPMDEPYNADFRIEEINGIANFSDSYGQLHLQAQGMTSAPSYWCNIEDVTSSNSLISVRFKLGTRDNALNGVHPMLHINMLADYSDINEYRLLAAIEEGSINFSSIVNGAATLNDAFIIGTDYFNDGNYHVLHFYINGTTLYVYQDLNMPAVYQYVFDAGLPVSGDFLFECHQEVYIDELIIANEITGTLDLN